MSVNSHTRRTIIAAIAAAVAVAVLIGTIVIRARLGPYLYFMPGDLGRQRVPLGAIVRVEPSSRRTVEQFPSNRRTEAHSIGTDRPLDRSTDRQYRALPPPPSGLISAYQRVSVSAFHHASPYLTRSIGLRAGTEAEWGRHNGVTPALNFSHHLSTVFPRALYATHPEFFPLINGRRFDPPKGYDSWNPDLGRKDVATFAAQQASRYFDSHPDAVSYSLGINDGLLFGDSAETLGIVELGRASLSDRSYPLSVRTNRQSQVTNNEEPRVPRTRWFRHRPDYSALVFTFMNRAAVEVAKTHPDKYLGCLAYYWCENTPPFAVDPHVIPFLTADRSQSYDEAFRRQEFRLQEKWAATVGVEGTLNAQRSTLNAQVTNPNRSIDLNVKRYALNVERSPKSRLGLYDYLDGQGFLIPRVPIHAFAEHIRHAHDVGFTDYYGESSRNWGLDGPMPWVIAQLLRDPDANVDALLDEYYTYYFQSAAEPMRQFFERCEQQWMRQSGPSYWLKYYRCEAQADLFPPEVCRELRALLDKAMQLSQEATEKTEEGYTHTAGRSNSRTEPQSIRTDRQIDRLTARPAAAAAAAPSNSRTEAQSIGIARQIDRSTVRLNSADRRIDRSTDRQADAVRDRIRFVSDAFGVTERFVAFQNARTALARAVLAPTQITNNDTPITTSHPITNNQEPITTISPLTNNQQLITLLSTYREARANFVHYTHEIAAKWPLAFYPINWDDWLRDDPTYAVEVALRDRQAVDQSISRSVHPTTRDSADRSTVRQFESSTARPLDRSTERELLASASLSGPLQPGLRIGGLQFGIDLPAPWQSRLEPTEHGEAVLRTEERSVIRYPLSGGQEIPPTTGQEETGNGDNSSNEAVRSTNNHHPITNNQPRLLHLSAYENATMYQWQPAKPGVFYAASVQTRGRVASGDQVMLTLGWLDRNQRPVGKLVTMYLPTGDWPDWVTLRQGARAPANAAWIGIAIRVQHQVADDFAEFSDFHLREATKR